MLRHLTIAAAVVTALSLPARDAAAQLRLAAAGGPTFPLGVLGDGYDMGWHAQVSAGLSIPLLPISVRVDGAYNRFPAQTDGHFQLLSGTVNGVVTIPSLVITPYFIGGLGFYSSRFSNGPTTADDESSDIGANLGAGVRVGLPFLSVFAEARLHNVFAEVDALRYVPLSVGIHF